ncbi:DNA polymerase IV [Parvibacter caecicola]|uniref:DNA polymerase IV n=1 Tax=Parvibacter caecicola TaxID=747645 RepID=UPI00248C62DB|nr:DNA polymerase IV [Parvibacter caecicola]
MLPLEPWQGRAILLVDLDAFFASVEQLDHPAWRGKPVVVGGDAHRHGVVSTCSYEARSFGVRSAMPASTAARLCPDAIWTPGRFDRYREMSRQVMAILHDETPHVQQVSIDEAFMDVTPNALNTEHPVAIAQRIQRRVAELGVTCSIGVGSTKAVAKIASDQDKPRGITVVYPGTERTFMAPLPVRDLSGIGPAAEAQLKARGIKTLGELAQASPAVLQRIFGIRADEMRARALGADTADVQQDDAVKSVSHEVTFADDLTGEEEILASLFSISTMVGRRLRRKGLKGRTLAVRMRYDDRSTRSVQRPLAPPSDDELAWRALFPAMMGELWAPGMKVRLLGVAVSGFDGPAGAEASLFDEVGDTPEAESALRDQRNHRLLEAADALKERFGEKAVRFGSDLSLEGKGTGSSSKNPSDYK